MSQVDIVQREQGEPTIALLAVPPDGPAGDPLRRWLNGWQAIMNRDATAAVPTDWLHMPLAVLGRAADAPAGLNQAVAEAVTARPWGEAVDGAVARCDHDLADVFAPTGSDGGIYTDFGIVLGNLTLLAVKAATTAGIRDAHVATCKPDQPHWLIGHRIGEHGYPGGNYWHTLRTMSPHITYPIDRLLLVDLFRDPGHHHHTWRVRQEIQLPRRDPYVNTGASEHDIMNWYLATLATDTFDPSRYPTSGGRR